MDAKKEAPLSPAGPVGVASGRGSEALAQGDEGLARGGRQQGLVVTRIAEAVGADGRDVVLVRQVRHVGLDLQALDQALARPVVEEEPA